MKSYEILIEDYKKSLRCKTMCVEELQEVRDNDEIIFYVSLWKNEPNLDLLVLG